MKRLIRVHETAWVGLIAALSMLMVMGCGGGSGGSEGGGTARVAFNARWVRGERSALSDQRAGVDDCLDVESVTAAVYSSGGLLQEGGPWNCADRQGMIAGVPAGNTVWVAITGYGANGRALYYGESPSFFLAAGETHDAGTILAGSFVPLLSAPADGAVVASNAFSMRWSDVEGAERYRVTLYSDSDFVTEIHSVSLPAGVAPSYTPGAELFTPGIPYYWRVQAMDGAGNLGEYSEGRGFIPTDLNLIVDIISPTVTDLLYTWSPTPFEGSVSYPVDMPFSADELASVVWRSDLDGVLGNTLLFDRNLSMGTHVLSLEVTTIYGLSGTASVTVSVSN